jgi:hypothetical protein
MSSGEHLITLAQLKALDPQHPGIGLLTGRTPLFARQADQRFSYCLCVPRDIDTSHRHPLLVAVHGTERSVQSYRDAFADLADAHQCIVLAHRFLYLHPDRLAGVSIGAPGRVTLLDPATPWPAGTADIAERFGTDVPLDALRDVPVRLLIGECDNQPRPPVRSTRVASITQLRDNLLDHGLKPMLETVPGAAHEGTAIFPAANRFFHELLQARRA